MISLGIDLGRSGHTAFSVIVGDGWDMLRLVHLETHQSIMATDVERYLVTINARFSPSICIVESNGPGGVFADFVAEHHPGIPLYPVDVSQPPFTLFLFNDIKLDASEYLNVRAENYFILRYLLKAGRLKFAFEDAELFSQLSSTFWDVDKSKSEKIRLMPKRNMKISNFTSELEGIQFSRSPDKADSLALACLGYAILMQDDLAVGKGQAEEEIIQPEVEGYFDLGSAGIEVE